MTEQRVEALAMPDQQKNTVLVPQQQTVGRISALHTVGYTAINLDVEKETYPIKGGNGARGLHKSALNKIASAAGIRIISSAPVGDVTPDHLMWQVKVELPMAGEKPVTGIGTKEWHAGVGLDGKDVEHRVSKTETKAMLRAIRQVLGVQSKYDPADLAKTIYVPHIDYNPDVSDPGVVNMLKPAADDATARLYGTSADEEVINIDPETGVMEEDAGEAEVVEEPSGFAPTAEAEPEDDSLNRLRELQGHVLQSGSSPFDSMTLASIWTDPKGGQTWCEQVIQWGANTPDLGEAQAAEVKAVSDFYDLIVGNGGELV